MRHDNGGAYNRGRCKTCRRPLATSRYGDCERCKAETRRLGDLHRNQGDRKGHPNSPAHEARVERYAAIVAAGGRIFE